MKEIEMNRSRFRASCLLFLGLTLALPFALTAEPVSAEQAKRAAAGWIRGRRSLDRKLGQSVVSATTYAATNGAAFHVVKLDTGFVVTTGDTTLDPVIVHSSGEDLVPDELNPLWALVRKDVALRAQAAGVVAATGLVKKVAATAAGASAGLSAAERAWADLLAEGEASQTAATNGIARKVSMSVASLADVRVEPLVQSTWDQLGVGSKYVYNYYTPGHVYCGCVATAGAQILRYFEWPKTPMSTFTCAYCSYEGTTTTYTSQGGTYDWSNMPLKPTTAITETQQKAIGKLTSDVGICTGMDYTSGGSGTGGYMLQYAFTTHFGYSNAMAVQRDTCCTDEETKRAFVSNFDAGLPVAVFIGVSGANSGHAIVGDGYGYSDTTLYYHLNLGWGGGCDAWYAPPNLAAGGYNFNVLDGFVYNIYTNGSAEAVICSGRILDSSGKPIAGVTVSAIRSGVIQKSLTTNEKGIYAFILSAGTYTIEATAHETSATKSVTLSKCVNLSVCSLSSGHFGSYWTSPSPSVGNVCDQDITLVLPTYEILEHPAFVPYTQVTRTASGTTSSAVSSRFEDGAGNVVYSILTEKGREYALGLDGYPEGDWVTGDGTPQLLKAKKPANGAYQVLTRSAE